MIRAGQLRHLCVIQIKNPSGGQNDYGEEDIVWVDNEEVWCAIFPLRGNEYHVAREQSAVITHKVRARYFTLADGTRPVPGNFRIKYFDHKIGINRFFDPQGGPIVPEEREYYEDIMCIENV